MSKLIVTFNIDHENIASAIREAVENDDYKAVAECIRLYDADKMEVIDE